MELSSSKPPERDTNNQNHPSPRNNGKTNTSSSCCSSSNNGGPPPPLTPTPNPVSRSSHDPTNPYPTTFVQADTSSFKQVVQLLTGSSDTKRPDQPPPRGGIPPIKSGGAQKKQGFKLYERRNSLKNASLMIQTLPQGSTSFVSPRKHHGMLSPSILDFPALVLSPVTPMNEDTAALRKAAAAAEEERAIAEKKFYFHPSPRTAAEDGEPRLLPLFPVTSPRVSGSS